jgi:predicted amidohydrolase
MSRHYAAHAAGRSGNRSGRRATSARAAGARLVLFPECAIGGYLREPMPGEHAPELPVPIAPDGREIAQLIALAGDTVVCAGYTEASPDRPYRLRDLRERRRRPGPSTAGCPTRCCGATRPSSATAAARPTCSLRR